MVDLPCEGCDPDKFIDRVDVYYPDGLHTEPWDELPTFGVQIIVLHYADGTRRVLMGNDYYFRAKGPADWIYGQTDHKPQLDQYPDAVVLEGGWTDDATFAGLQRRALGG